MKRILLSFIIAFFMFLGNAHAQTVMNIAATDGNINEVIQADTTSDGSQAHDIYQLVTLDRTYQFTGALVVKSDVKIVGIVDSNTGRPPCVQPAVLSDFSIPATFLVVNGAGAKVSVENVYILAYATNNTANGDGVAISVTADNVRLTVENCVFDGWQAFGIGYNGQWCDFFLNNNNFRNFVHPNQHYIGEVIRNTWPGEAYTDTLSMVGNTMLCVNGYAAAPVTKYYETFFEFVGNKVLYTFKNPFFIFNATDAKINDNVFYANYAGGVDTTENPWWDNLWFPDTTYGVIAFQPLNEANAKMFDAADSSASNFLDLAEAKRTLQVKNNTYFWPKGLTDFWANWNATQSNTIITPKFMNDRTMAMFSDKSKWPGLDASNNVNADPGYMTEIDKDVLNGTPNGDIGLLKYFEQIRTGTASVDYWGYGYTDVTGEANWVPTWPLPESVYVTTAIDNNPIVSVPNSFALTNIYPNPFNPSSTIEYTLSKAGVTRLEVYNVLGQQIMTLVDNAYQTPNTYKVTVDMSAQTSGMYFVVLKQDGNNSVKKMMLLK